MNRIIVTLCLLGSALAFGAAQKTDINNALQIQLEKLPGITRLLAKKIVANRPYEKIEDLTRAGVPTATIDKLRPLVTVEPGMPSNHVPRPKVKKR